MERNIYFDRLCRLYGKAVLEKLKAAHVLICGLGGVGSWAAEAIARTAIGRITLADFDIIGGTNINRQLPALSDTIGIKKTEAMAARFRKINPESAIKACDICLNPSNIPNLLAESPDIVIDAIDNVTAKCFLIAHCRKNGIPIIVSCGSGGRTDPSKIKVCDLAETQNDALARSVRYILRQKYGFPRKGRFGIQAVCSSELPHKPFSGINADESRHVLPFGSLHFQGSFSSELPSGFPAPGIKSAVKSEVNAEKSENPANSVKLGNTDSMNNNNSEMPVRRSFINGTACFVTGSFGFFCASEAVKKIIAGIDAGSGEFI